MKSITFEFGSIRSELIVSRATPNSSDLPGSPLVSAFFEARDSLRLQASVGRATTVWRGLVQLDAGGVELAL